MVNKKKQTRKSGKRIDWKYLCLFVILQIILIVSMPLAIYSSWPSNDRNTQTVTGEIEQIEWKRRFGKHNESYVVIMVDGQEYCIYARRSRNEMHSRDIEQTLVPGDVVEISYKTGFHHLKPYNHVIGLEDQTQEYRTVEAYNASAVWLVPLLIAMVVIAELLACAPFYLTELLALIVYLGAKKRKKKKEKRAEFSQKPMP